MIHSIVQPSIVVFLISEDLHDQIAHFNLMFPALLCFTLSLISLRTASTSHRLLLLSALDRPTTFTNFNLFDMIIVELLELCIINRRRLVVSLVVI